MNAMASSTVDTTPWLEDLHDFPFGPREVALDRDYVRDRLAPLTTFAVIVTALAFVAIIVRLMMGVFAPKWWLCWGLFCCCKKRSCGKSCGCCGRDAALDRVSALRQTQQFDQRELDALQVEEDVRCDNSQVYTTFAFLPVLAAAVYTYFVWQEFRSSGVVLGDRLLELDFSNAIGQASIASSQADWASGNASDLHAALLHAPPPIAAYAPKAAMLEQELSDAASDSGSVSGDGLGHFDDVVDRGSSVLRERSSTVETWGAVGIGAVPLIPVLVLLASLSCGHPAIYYAAMSLAVILLVSLAVGVDSIPAVALALADTCAAPSGTLRTLGRAALGYPQSESPYDSESLSLLWWYTGDCAGAAQNGTGPGSNSSTVPGPIAAGLNALAGATNASRSATELYTALLAGGPGVPSSVIGNASAVANATSDLVFELTSLQSDYLACGVVQRKVNDTMVQLCDDVGHSFGMLALGLALLWVTLLVFMWVGGCMCSMHPATESKLEFSNLGRLRRIADSEERRLHPPCGGQCGCCCDDDPNGAGGRRANAGTPLLQPRGGVVPPGGGNNSGPAPTSGGRSGGGGGGASGGSRPGMGLSTPPAPQRSLSGPGRPNPGRHEQQRPSREDSITSGSDLDPTDRDYVPPAPLVVPPKMGHDPAGMEIGPTAPPAGSEDASGRGTTTPKFSDDLPDWNHDFGATPTPTGGSGMVGVTNPYSPYDPYSQSGGGMGMGTGVVGRGDSGGTGAGGLGRKPTDGSIGSAMASAPVAGNPFDTDDAPGAQAGQQPGGSLSSGGGQSGGGMGWAGLSGPAPQPGGGIGLLSGNGNGAGTGTGRLGVGPGGVGLPDGSQAIVVVESEDEDDDDDDDRRGVAGAGEESFRVSAPPNFQL